MTNNALESFNNQMKTKGLKGLLVHEMVDGIREMIMEKFALRRDCGKKMEDGILPNMMKELNNSTGNLKVIKMPRNDDVFVEVTLVESDNSTKRHIVDLDSQHCSCRVWQVTRKPCKHALAWICTNRGKIQDFVNHFYSMQSFRAAYAGRIPTMTDRTQWPSVDLGFKVHPPRLRRGAGKPRVQRTRGCLEPGRNKVRCKRDASVFGTLRKLAS